MTHKVLFRHAVVAVENEEVFMCFSSLKLCIAVLRFYEVDTPQLLTSQIFRSALVWISCIQCCMFVICRTGRIPLTDNLSSSVARLQLFILSQSDDVTMDTIYPSYGTILVRLTAPARRNCDVRDILASYLSPLSINKIKVNIDSSCSNAI